MANPTTSPQKLFRPESTRARELAWQGRPALALGLPTTFTSLASIALAAVAAALITFGSYARRVDMQGAVLPATGLIAISAPSPGWIKTLAAREGEPVDKDAVLYTLDLDTATKDGSTQQQIIKVLTGEREMLVHQIDRKLRMSEETRTELCQKIENLKAQIDQLGEQLATQQGFFKTISDEYNLFVDLVQRRTASLSELATRRQTWMQLQTKLHDLQSSKLRLKAELSDAQYQLATLPTTTGDDIDALKSKIVGIDEKLANTEARRSIEIRAPDAGTVTTIVKHPGQIVGASAPLLKIVPRDAAMHAELLAPSSAIGFIHRGERVLLRYSAFPYQKFGEHWGTVVSLSHAALSPEEVQSLLAGAPPLNQSGPFYRVIVEPDSQFVRVHGEERGLPASMQVQAYALLDRRPLYSWILNPLYDVGRAAHWL